MIMIMTTMIMTRELSPGPQMLQRRAPSTAGSLASLRLIIVAVMMMMIAMEIMMKAIAMMMMKTIMMTYIAVTLICLPHQVAN